MKKLKENKGITLVALVLTIIILIILAYVAINAVSDNGIIGEAKKARFDQEKAQAEEQFALILNEWKLFNINGDADLEEFLESKKDKGIIDSYTNIGSNTYMVTMGDYTFKLNPDLTFTALVESDSGEAKDKIHWVLYDDGLLVISGTGEMKSNPWITEHKLDIKKVVIGEGITSIAERAFLGCTNLEEITIPESVNKIGSYAFHSCTNLSNINIEDLNAWLSIDYGTTIFTNAKLTHDIKLNGEIITEAIFPDGLKKAGDAVSHCPSIEKVVLPQSLESLGSFQKCTNLKKLEIPSKVTSIPEYCFQGCTNLEEITIPESVNKINRYAFHSCTNLSNINIEDLNAWLSIDYGTTIFINAKGAHNINLNGKIVTEAIFPEGLKKAGDAVSYCPSIEKVVLPQSLESLGSFQNCTNLKKLEIPSNVTSIPGYCFQYCTNLEEITIPESINSIESCAFHSCTKLKELEIPNGVISIGSQAFYNCSNLTNITIDKTQDSITGSPWGAPKGNSIITWLR